MAKDSSRTKVDEKSKMGEVSKEHYDGINTSNLEFGGPIGVLALMLWSHYIILYFW